MMAAIALAVVLVLGLALMTALLLTEVSREWREWLEWRRRR